MPRCTIGNPNPRGLGGPYGFELLLPWYDGWLTKTLFTSLGKSLCKFTNFVPLGVCGLDLILPIVIIGVDTNGASITIIID